MPVRIKQRLWCINSIGGAVCPSAASVGPDSPQPGSQCPAAGEHIDEEDEGLIAAIHGLGRLTALLFQPVDCVGWTITINYLKRIAVNSTVTSGP
jgi:hypothetical protein